MKQAIYYLSTLVVFTLLICGVDGWFGHDVRSYSIVLFIAWMTQTVVENWEDLKEFFSVMKKDSKNE